MPVTDPANFAAPFAAALLDPDHAPPSTLRGPHDAQPVQRFAVYRNNVMVSLVAALETRFPVVRRLVGDDFFAAMARIFVAAQPPRSPLLMTYGDDLADFIAGFPPAQDLPYLADVARLEAARTRAYHGPDAAPLDHDALQAVPAAALPDLRLTLHPTLELVRSPHPIVGIWAMNSGEAELVPIDDWHGEDALVARPALAVEVRALPPGGAAFIAALQQSAPLAAAATEAGTDDARFDLAANLAGLIGAGLVTGLTLPQAEDTP